MITIYTKDHCNSCVQAKALLRSKDIPFNEVRIGEDIPVDTVKEIFPLARTVPIIVVEGVNIGGFENLVTYLKEQTTEDGELLLQE